MIDYIEKQILLKTGAASIEDIVEIQALWKGYGKILRVYLNNCPRESVIVKHIAIPKQSNKTQNNLSHSRKIKSYDIETSWYQNWSPMTNEKCHVPAPLLIERRGRDILLILEDLADTGYPVEKISATWNEMKTCISWLANFHGTFMGKKPVNLWKTGTYWHLATRPDELKALADSSLKKAAQAIDTKLRQSPFQTFVHGDAKLANFCFSTDGNRAAAVDFQYVGGGCGMKDLAYFTGSCLHDDESESMENQILDYYFLELSKSFSKKNDINFSELEENWRLLYHVAWVDFHRFYKGWSHNHWNSNSYSEKISKEVIKKLV